MARRDLLAASALTALPWAAARAAEAPPLELPAVRLGLLGLHGHIGEALQVARRWPQVQITAVETSSERERAKASANPLLRAATHYNDYRKLLASEKLDAVCICDENHRRAETITACLEKGIPTAAEKPFATSIAALDALEALAARSAVPLTMLLPMRFESTFVAMKQLVSSGAIGEPAQLSGQKSYQLGERPEWMKRRERFGGTIPYIACHTVDLLRFISGRDMIRTAAFHGNVGAPEIRRMENTCSISYGLDNGGTADVRLDYLRPQAAPGHGDDRIRIAGTDGVVEYQSGKVTLVTDRLEPHEITQRPWVRPLMADFLDSVFNNTEPMLRSEEAFRVTRIVLRSREAADSGRVLSI